MKEIRVRKAGRRAALIDSYMRIVAGVAIPFNICDQDGLRMDTGWPAEFEKQGALKISTIGRRTGRRHEVTIELVRTQDTPRRLLKSLRSNRSDGTSSNQSSGTRATDRGRGVSGSVPTGLKSP